ncbi:MAG: hypothetical protein IJE07_14410 [Clostridia bacterium]|nr:hypothetical protein [Clostridia bacterium]
MSNYVDIHHHLIYGVDDGPRTFEDMQQMILRAVNQQVSDIVCTAHATPGGRPFPTEIYLRHLEKARAWIAEQGLPLRLYTGCEVLYTDASARLLKEGQFPSLADSWNVLVEFTPDTDFKRMCEAARLIGNAGFSVVFAHVERYPALRNLGHVRQLREEYGVYMQMNANTVINRKGFFFDRWVRHMLDDGHIDCVATDAHNVTSRMCNMRLCYEMLKERYGREIALDMCGGFQRKLLKLPQPEEA